MTDLRQSKGYANYLKSIGWKVEKVDTTYIYLKKIPVLGWFAKIQRPSVLNDEIINFIEKKYHPFQISIEPSNYFPLKGFKQADPSLPTKTLQIDLTKSQKEILNSFSSKTRYNVRNVAKRRIEVVESKNILDFTNFWRQNFEKKRFPILSQQKNIIALSKSFGKKSKILLAKKGDQTIASFFLLSYDKVEYYMYAASSDAGRSNFAPTLLTWHAILFAKKSGCKTFDFDGIYDDRFPIKSWLGFTKFKKGFGGKEIQYPGRFIKTKNIIKI
jgi:lipid II:glycine glycyltransferase (peptidoglycan interpeptide bridge formation enzyme)